MGERARTSFPSHCDARADGITARLAVLLHQSTYSRRRVRHALLLPQVEPSPKAHLERVASDI